MAKSVTKPKLPVIAMPGGVEASSGDKTPPRLALLLWGPASAGKTTFAATAPGVKLWISLGDNEAASVSHRSDVIVADYSAVGYEEFFKHAQSDNPLGLDRVLRENESIETVVLDSATALAYRALQKSVLELKVGAGKNFTPTMEAPGISAYGGRNAIVLEVVTGLLRVTAKYGVNVVMTAHEDDPTMREENINNRIVEVIDHIGIQLGGRLVNNMAWRWSEIWLMRNDQEKRDLTIRNFGKYRPMKTRMFTTKDKIPRFELVYDPEKPDDAKGQMTIAGWHNQWLSGGRKSIQLPKGASKD